ncbi:TPA: hypothetical protein ACXE8V_004670 [Pluralibacter gergoviae]
MSWPVKIIPPDDNIPDIKWKKWFFLFLLMLFCAVSGVSIAKIILPANNNEFLKLFSLFLLLCLFLYFIAFSVRVYYYGVCLSAYEASEHKAALVRHEWTEWASQKLYVFAHNLFLPSVISSKDISLNVFSDIYNDQQLKLRDHNGESYTEEQIVYELLASIRAQLLALEKSCTFDIIFTYGSGCITFSLFRQCWVEIGFSDSCLGEFNYRDEVLEQDFDMLSNISVDRGVIIISANIENVEGYSPASTEFASILLLTHREQLQKKGSNSVVLRTMACTKDTFKQEIIHMMAYQPDVIRTSRVLFSNMSVNDALDVSDALRTSCLSMGVEWDYEVQHLNLILGKLSDVHFWLVFALALFVSQKNGKSVLTVARTGDNYIFNVIKSMNYSEEH